MLNKWRKFLETEKLFNKGQKILLAVSGGLDSMVLLEFMLQIEQPIIVAHCNFKLRGKESDADASFLRKKAKAKGFKVFVKNFDTEKFANKNNV
ncbi:MAG: ATP-binding protein, partial [Chitinophagales bacterium]